MWFGGNGLEMQILRLAALLRMTDVIRRTILERFVRRTGILTSGTIRPIDYFVEPGVSFGGTPMTFTPEPRAMSIAWTTRSYFTSGEPFTKMTFSGRGS